MHEGETDGFIFQCGFGDGGIYCVHYHMLGCGTFVVKFGDVWVKGETSSPYSGSGL